MEIWISVEGWVIQNYDWSTFIAFDFDHVRYVDVTPHPDQDNLGDMKGKGARVIIKLTISTQSGKDCIMCIQALLSNDTLEGLSNDIDRDQILNSLFWAYKVDVTFEENRQVCPEKFCHQKHSMWIPQKM